MAATAKCFIAMAPNAWGKGETQGEAIKKAKSIYGPGCKDYDVYLVHPETNVDGYGALCWPTYKSDNAEESITKHQPILILRVRKGKEEALEKKAEVAA